MFFLVSDKYQFLMGWSAKCGCSSVKRWYLDVHGIPPRDLPGSVHESIGYGNTQYTKVAWGRAAKYAEYRKFLVVRDPYSRLVSGFLNKYVVHKEMPNRGWDSFSEFLHALKKDSGFRQIDRHHFTPQFSEAYDHFIKSGMAFDKVIPLEHLQASLNQISADLGLPVQPARRANQTDYKHPEGAALDWADASISLLERGPLPPHTYFYNTTTQPLAEHIYSKDFELLRRFGLDYQLPDGLQDIKHD